MSFASVSSALKSSLQCMVIFAACRSRCLDLNCNPSGPTPLLSNGPFDLFGFGCLTVSERPTTTTTNLHCNSLHLDPTLLCFFSNFTLLSIYLRSRRRAYTNSSVFGCFTGYSASGAPGRSFVHDSIPCTQSICSPPFSA